MPGHAVVAIDDVLVHLGAPGDVVGLDREHFLQGVGCAVGSSAHTSISPKRWPPNWALPPSGCWVTRLYGSGRTGVHLVVDQVVELQHVHVAHRDRPVERIAGAAVVQRGLAAFGRPASFSICLISASSAPSKTGVAIGTPLRRLRASSRIRRRSGRLDVLLASAAAAVVDFGQEAADLARPCAALPASCRSGRRARAPPSRGAFPAPGPRSCARARRAGSARCPPGCRRPRRACPRPARSWRSRPCCRGVRPSCRRAAAALHGEVDLDHLEHARGEIVARGQLALLLLEAGIEQLLAAAAAGSLRICSSSLRSLVVLDADVNQSSRQLVEVADLDLVALLQARGPCRPPCRSAGVRGAGRSRFRRCGTGRRGPCGCSPAGLSRCSWHARPSRRRRA
jgi:hypothetical protein